MSPFLHIDEEIPQVQTSPNSIPLDSVQNDLSDITGKNNQKAR